MVIHNFHVLSASIRPAEAYAELIINAYAVLARAIASQGFQSIAWRNPEIFQSPRTAMAISSDGRFIVYSAIKENAGPQDQPRLYLRRTDQSVSTPIAGTEGGINPFLSPMTDGWDSGQASFL